MQLSEIKTHLQQQNKKYYPLEYNFIKCGLTGWFFEVIWTGFHNLLAHDRTLTCNTSLLMFPIYGMAFCISPLYHHMEDKHFIIRGSVYTTLIFSGEFLSGLLLKKFQMCPWDYSGTPFNIKGIIRLDYAPAWFIVGLIYEKMLK